MPGRDTADTGSMTSMCPLATINAPGTYAADTTMAPDELAGSCGGSANEATWEFTAPNDATYVFDSIGFAYDTAMYVVEDCTGAIELDCNDDTDGMQSQVSVALISGQSVIVVIDGSGGATGAATLNVTEFPFEICDDTIDNDFDGDPDCVDSECAFDPACIEICDNGVDEDGNCTTARSREARWGRNA